MKRMNINLYEDEWQKKAVIHGKNQFWMGVLYIPNQNNLKSREEGKYSMKIQIAHFKKNILKGLFWVYAWTFETTGDDEDAIKNIKESDYYSENCNFKDPKVEIQFETLVSSGCNAFEIYDRIGYKYFHRPLYSTKMEDNFNENT